jgi:hypothetical protein
MQQADYAAWFPALEANQGTLSLLALAFAVAWGLWEQHRANLAEQWRERRAITDAADIIERSSNLIVMQSQLQIPFSVLCERMRLTGDALVHFAAANGAMPALAVAVLRAAAQFHRTGGAASPTNLAQLAPDVVKEITTIRAEIDALLTVWEREHLPKWKRLLARLRRQRRAPRIVTARHP